jgi:hypothetical protein
VIAGNNISITPSVLGNAVNVAITNDLNMGNHDIIAIDNLKLFDVGSVNDATINFDGTNVVIDTPIKPTTIADSASSTGTINQVLASTGTGGLVWVNGGGAGVGVNSVTGGTNISTTGTITNPIVNLAITSDINMGSGGGNFSVNNINNAMFRHLPSFNTATISFDATNLTTDKPIKPDGICDNNNVTGGAGQVLTSDGAGNIVWATGAGSGVTSVSAGTGISVTGPSATPTVSNTGLLGLTSANAGTNITITGPPTAPVISATGSGGPGLTLVERNDYTTYNIPAPTATGEQLSIYSSIGIVGSQFGTLNGFPSVPAGTVEFCWLCVERDGNPNRFWYGGFYTDGTGVETGLIARYDTTTNTWNTPYIYDKKVGSPNNNARVYCLKLDSDGVFMYVGGDFNDGPAVPSGLPGPYFAGCASFETTSPSLYNDMAPLGTISYPPAGVLAYKSQNIFDNGIIYAIEYAPIGPTSADFYLLVGGEFSWVSINAGGPPPAWYPANNIIVRKGNPSGVPPVPGGGVWYPPTYQAAQLANPNFVPPTTAGLNGIVYSISFYLPTSSVAIGGAFTQQNGGTTSFDYYCKYDLSFDTYLPSGLPAFTTTGPSPYVSMVHRLINSIWIGMYNLNIDLTSYGGSATNQFLISSDINNTPIYTGYGATIFAPITAFDENITTIAYNPSNGRYIFATTNIFTNPSPLNTGLYEFIDTTPSITALIPGITNVLIGPLKMISNATNNELYIPSYCNLTASPAPVSAVITYEYDTTSGPNVYPAGILFGDGTTQTTVSLGLNQAINLLGRSAGGQWLLASKNF